MSKLITFAVPCYNSAAYMDHCVRTLLTGGDDIEIILVDDGSTKDDTPAIAMSLRPVPHHRQGHPPGERRPRRRGQPGPAPRPRDVL